MLMSIPIPIAASGSSRQPRRSLEQYIPMTMTAEAVQPSWKEL